MNGVSIQYSGIRLYSLVATSCSPVDAVPYFLVFDRASCGLKT